MDVVEMEGVGWGILCDADMVGISRPRPTQAAARLDLEVVFDIPPGAHGRYQPINRLHIAPAYDEDDLQDRVAHEVTHVGMSDRGVPTEEQEAFVDDAKLTWRMPRYTVLRLVRRHGFIPQMLVQFFRKVARPTDVLRRCAAICPVAVILQSNVTGRHLFADGVEGPVKIGLEEKDVTALIRKVRKMGKPEVWGFGVIAWPYNIQGNRGVAIVVDLEKTLTWEQ
jgi:hypothetical protein